MKKRILAVLLITAFVCAMTVFAFAAPAKDTSNQDFAGTLVDVSVSDDVYVDDYAQIAISIENVADRGLPDVTIWINGNCERVYSEIGKGKTVEFIFDNICTDVAGDQFFDIVVWTRMGNKNFQDILYSGTATLNVMVRHVCNFVRTEYPPTCTEDGYAINVCECGEVEEGYWEYLGAACHDYEVTVAYPTETEGGYTTNTCRICGYNYNYDFTAPLTTKTILDKFNDAIQNGDYYGTGPIYLVVDGVAYEFISNSGNYNGNGTLFCTIEGVEYKLIRNNAGLVRVE